MEKITPPSDDVEQKPRKHQVTQQGLAGHHWHHKCVWCGDPAETGGYCSEACKDKHSEIVQGPCALECQNPEACHDVDGCYLANEKRRALELERARVLCSAELHGLHAQIAELTIQVGGLAAQNRELNSKIVSLVHLSLAADLLAAQDDHASAIRKLSEDTNCGIARAKEAMQAAWYRLQ